MHTIRKYSFVLLLSLAVIFVYAPLSLEDAVKFPWLGDISVIIDRCLAPKPEVGASSFHPITAANIDNRQIETLGSHARAATIVAAQSPSSTVPPTVAPAQAPRWRAAGSQNGMRWSVSWRSLGPRRHATRWRAPGLPPILMALLGEGPRSSTALRQVRASSGRLSSRNAGIGKPPLLRFYGIRDWFRPRAPGQTLAIGRMPWLPLPGKDALRGA